MGRGSFTGRNKKTVVSEVGFEPTPPFGDQNPQGEAELESGALDHSAILTLHVLLLHAEPDVCDTCQRPMSVVIQAYSPCPQPPDPAN